MQRARNPGRIAVRFFLTLCAFAAVILFTGNILSAFVTADGTSRAAQVERIKPRVLILHSYHHGFTWSDNISKGIRSAFLDKKGDIELIFEFMDTRRIHTEHYFQALKKILSVKYAGRKVDVIICSDDHALNFMLTLGQDIFPHVPVVFCSVSGYEPWMRHERQLTGLLESIDIESTLDLALKFHPYTEEVAVICDMTRTGRALKQKAQAVFKKYESRVAFRYLEDLTIEELNKQVSGLSEKTIVFLFIFSRDKAGRVFSHEENLGILYRHCDLPIYAVWEFYLGHGIVGGKLSSGLAEGERAGQMALRILEGMKASEIPLDKSPTRYIFDYAQLQRFAIEESLLPKESIIINKPFSFYEQYRLIIWSVGIAMVLMACLIAALAGDILKRRRSEGALRESEERFRRAVTDAPFPIMIHAEDGEVIQVNRIWTELTGYSQNQIPTISEWTAKAYGERKNFVKEGIDKLYSLDTRVEEGEFAVKTTDGTTLVWDFSSAPLGKLPDGRRLVISMAMDITERKSAKEQVETLARFPGENPSPVLRVAESGVVLYGNEASHSLLKSWGYEAGKPLTDRWRSVVSEALASSSAREAEVAYDDRTVSLSFVPIVDGGYVNIYGQDITQRKKAEAALVQSESKYRDLIEKATDPIYTLDMEGTFLEVNDAFLREGDYSAEDIIGRRFDMIMHPDDKSVVLKSVERARQGKEYQYELRAKRKDGDFSWYSIKNRPLFGEDGNVAAVHGIARNIDALKRVEAALKESEEKYRTLFDSANDAIFVMEGERFIDCNAKTLDLFGCTRDQIIGKTPYDYSPLKQPDGKDSKESALEKIRPAFQGTPQFFEWQHSRYDGSVFDCEVSLTVMKVSGESYVLAIVRDISERKRAEKDREKLEQQVHQAQKMEAIGTLAGGIAHDFNNLLMGIQGNASLILLDVDSRHPHHEKLKSIEQYVQSGTELTKQLLGFARGGKYEVKPTDLNELVEESARMFGRTRKDIKIRKKLQEDLWVVEVDQGQMEQVLLNLYVNAWQAMPVGGELFLQTENVVLDEDYVRPFDVLPGTYVKISVTDTGIGMDEAIQKKVFEPFFTTKGMGRGTGLGLASVYGIIKNHGGLINVYSEQGEGTTFNIYLPSSEKEVEKRRDLEEDIVKGSETVLLVDDEPMILDVGAKLLNRLGYKVLLATSGREALDVYERNKDAIALVVLDMVMPDMGGGDTYDQLKKINPSIKVLLASGYSINGQAQAILDRGCDAFIQKPFNLKELSRKLREILDKQ